MESVVEPSGSISRREVQQGIKRRSNENMRCGYEIPGMILLQAYLCTYSLLRGVTFSSNALSPMMLPLLETFLKLLLWNSLQCHHHTFCGIFNILKFSSF
jgi:hypothetical protein